MRVSQGCNWALSKPQEEFEPIPSQVHTPVLSKGKDVTALELNTAPHLMVSAPLGIAPSITLSRLDVENPTLASNPPPPQPPGRSSPASAAPC